MLVLKDRLQEAAVCFGPDPVKHFKSSACINSAKIEIPVKSRGLKHMTKRGHLLKLSLPWGALSELKPWGFFLKHNCLGIILFAWSIC